MKNGVTASLLFFFFFEKAKNLGRSDNGKWRKKEDVIHQFIPVLFKMKYTTIIHQSGGGWCWIIKH